MTQANITFTENKFKHRQLTPQQLHQVVMQINIDHMESLLEWVGDQIFDDIVFQARNKRLAA